MVEKIITRILHRRHYWRHITFSELAELYASRVLRTTALMMMSVFVAVFMYQTGYSLTFIALYFSAQFLLRGLFSLPSAHIIGRFGPKHATLFSNLLYIPALYCLSNLEHYGWIVLIGYGFFQALSASIYNIAHHVEFSLVKHRQHAGKEIGYMVALERIAMTASPLIGGGIAYVFGPQATAFAAMLLFAVAAAPLLLSPEPIRPHQKIAFWSLPWKKTRRSIFAHSFMGWDFIATGIVWSLFVAIAVFGTTNDMLYAQIGAVASVSVVTSILAARMYGKLIDTHRGGELLRFGVLGTASLHLIRPFVASAGGVVLMNAATESAKSAYNMPYVKGIFDLADDIPAHRVVYMAWQDFAISIGATIALLSFALLTSFGNDIGGMQLFYLLSAVIVLGITTHNLRALKIH